MRLQYHVVSKKMALALKDLGCRQKARYYWYGDILIEGDQFVPGFTKDIQAAYDVSEIGWMLKNIQFDTTIHDDGAYVQSMIHGQMKNFQAQTEVGARARLLEYLLTHKIIKAQDAQPFLLDIEFKVKKSGNL